jgi:hypothetical protein
LTLQLDLFQTASAAQIFDPASFPKPMLLDEPGGTPERKVDFRRRGMYSCRGAVWGRRVIVCESRVHYIFPPWRSPTYCQWSVSVPPFLPGSPLK